MLVLKPCTNRNCRGGETFRTMTGDWVICHVCKGFGFILEDGNSIPKNGQEEKDFRNGNWKLSEE